MVDAFGAQAIASEPDTSADLQKLGDALATLRYATADVEKITGGNWFRFLRAALK